jgi:elongation factor G
MANGFEPQNIRNVVVVGHKGSGKTSLVEAMLYVGGSTPSLGNVFNKTSVLDDEPEEQARSARLQTSVGHVVWRATKINIIDTPGEGSFFGDTRAAIAAADAVVLVVSAKDGVQPMTERVNGWALELGLPRYVVFTKCDLEHVRVATAIEAVKKRLKLSLATVQVTIGEGTDMKGIVELVSRKVFVGKADGPNTKSTTEVPADLKDVVNNARAQLVDEVASAAGNDELAEKYLEEGDLSDKEMESGLNKAVASGSLVPAFFVGSMGPYGIAALLDSIVDLFPAPNKHAEFKARVGDARAPLTEGALAAFCFKTTIDQHAGRNSYVRVVSGVLRPDTYVMINGQKERVGALFNVVGKNAGGALAEVYAGDIVNVTKMKSVTTGDTFCDERKPFEYAAPEPPPALFARVAVLQDRGSGEKIAQGLGKLSEEDWSLKISHDEQTHDLIVAGLSQLHLDVILERLKRRFGIDCILGPPKIPYKETISKKATGIEGKHKKQSGGHGQFGVCMIDMEPTPRNAGFIFEDAIVGGAIPRNFIPSVEKGIAKTSKRGYLAGFEVVDFKVRLWDGKYHDVDSSDAAFQLAGSKAFKAAMEKCGPIILEPVVKMEITVPTAALGDIMGDLNSRRGRILGSETQDAYSVVNAIAPLVEVLEYEPKLRALTQGTGTFTMTMDRYEPVPAMLQEKIIKDSGFKQLADEE